jgi:hypothetical protein
MYAAIRAWLLSTSMGAHSYTSGNRSHVPPNSTFALTAPVSPRDARPGHTILGE